MHNDDRRDARPEEIGGTGARGGNKVLKQDQQAPAGFDPDSEVDKKLRESGRPKLDTLSPATIVRN